MKVLALNGSPRARGNTAAALETVLEELRKEGIGTETLHVGGSAIRGCTGCGVCREKKDCRCIIDGDEANGWIAKMLEADGLLIGSPVYYAGINGTLKCLLDRAFFVAMVNGSQFRYKVGAPVVVARRGGSISAFEQINKFLSISEMFMPASNYWNMGYGMAPGDFAQDAEGSQTMRLLGRNMAWLMKAVEARMAAAPPHPLEERIRTNFIR